MSVARFLLAAFSVALLAFSPEAGAKTARPVDHTFAGNLTLDQAVKIALRQNPELLKQLQEIERTRGQIIEVRAEALPHLTL